MPRKPIGGIEGNLKVSCHLPRSTVARIEAKAIRRGCDKATVIREVLIEHFGQEVGGQLRSSS